VSSSERTDPSGRPADRSARRRAVSSRAVIAAGFSQAGRAGRLPRS
jgi:hypothetical protein